MDNNDRKFLIISLYIMTFLSLISLNIIGVTVFGGTYYVIKNEKTEHIKLWYVGTIINVILSILIFVVLLIWTIIYICCYFHNKDLNHETFIEFLKISISLLIISFIYMFISIFISVNVKQYKQIDTQKGENCQNYNRGIDHTYRNVAYPSLGSSLNMQYISRNSPNTPSLDTLPTYKSSGPSNSALSSSINYTINPNSSNELSFPSCPSYSSNTININANNIHSSNISRSIAISTPTLQQSIIRKTNGQDITSIESLPPPYSP